MRFGIYCEIQTPPGKSHCEMTWEIMRQIEHADDSGFDVYSVIDHHFFQKFSISANPLAMFAAAAQRTSRIRFRTALHTLPLENPMRLAGMIAETDILTNGRLECGLGRGHAWLFGPSALPLEESRPRHEEAIDILELAFAEEKFSYAGKYYNVKDVSVVPRPLQKPHPKFYTGGTSDITYQMAGEKGWGIFVPPLLPWKLLEGPLNIYKKACADHGHQSDIVYIRPVYIDHDEKQIRKEVEQALLNFLSLSTRLRWSRSKVRKRKPNCGPRATDSMPAGHSNPSPGLPTMKLSSRRSALSGRRKKSSARSARCRKRAA
jgi:alkanesulfonate monooxygenase SsuD/methylene tetrahydromethanopterin reductase-like flavin-dependent oxidoreductase (luciferase family)